MLRRSTSLLSLAWTESLTSYLQNMLTYGMARWTHLRLTQQGKHRLQWKGNLFFWPNHTTVRPLLLQAKRDFVCCVPETRKVQANRGSNSKAACKCSPGPSLPWYLITTSKQARLIARTCLDLLHGMPRVQKPVEDDTSPSHRTSVG